MRTPKYYTDLLTPKAKRGTNQHRKKYRHPLGLTTNNYIRVLWLLLFIALTVIIGYATKPKIISPCPESGCVSWEVKAAEPETELERIVAYIIQKWHPHGRQEAVKALACFISESGLRTDAININHNGTNDVGIAQINSVHGMTTEARLDWKKNIDKAYQLYKRSGWRPWYGAGCR